MMEASEKAPVDESIERLDWANSPEHGVDCCLTAHQIETILAEEGMPVALSDFFELETVLRRALQPRMWPDTTVSEPEPDGTPSRGTELLEVVKDFLGKLKDQDWEFAKDYDIKELDLLLHSITEHFQAIRKV